MHLIKNARKKNEKNKRIKCKKTLTIMPADI